MNWIKTAINVETRGMSLTSGFAFFLGVPFIVSLVLALNFAVVGNEVSLAASLFFWVGPNIIIWNSSVASSYAAYVLLGRWQPNLFVVLCIGQVISVLVFTVPIRAYLDWTMAYGWPGMVKQQSVPMAFSFEYVTQLFYGMSTATLTWFSTNYFYKLVLNIPRYHYGPWEPETHQTTDKRMAHALPAFLRRLPDPVKGDLLALKAEDHYVRVFTVNGDAMIYYRFKDAVSDMSTHQGLQTHRSYWVDQNAIVDVECEGQSPHLTLSTGLKVPISRTYLNDVKRSVADVAA